MTPTHEIVTQVTVTMPYSLLQIFVASAFACGFISCLALILGVRLWKRMRTKRCQQQRKPVEAEFYRSSQKRGA